ncbi:MAG: hypothetical protein K1X64_17925 [Myxococcaceae bacterium]|nr:hypothetical protein [Myxococcaceae bacterium]
MRGTVRLLLFVVGPWWLATGCAGGYIARTAQVRQAWQAGEPKLAVTMLDEAWTSGPSEKDKLLYLFDKGMLLHAAGEWEASIKVLAEADDLAQKLNFTSVSEEAGSVLVNESVRAYRGEDFERLMVSVLQALNYAQLGKDEDALVEIRRCNERLEKMVSDEKKPYEQLAIARYLGGVLYEDQQDWDAAAIDYLKAGELSRQLKGPAAEPLLRLAKKTAREDIYQALLKRYPQVEHAPVPSTQGQVVVIAEVGEAPEKEAGTAPGIGLAIPEYRGGSGWAPLAKLTVDGQAFEAATVTSVDAVARLHLQDRIGKLVARAVAGTAVKAGAAAAVGVLTKSSEAGVATFALLMAVTNHADLRSWLSLPAEFQVMRAPLKPGTYVLTVTVGGQRFTREAEVKAGRVSVVVVRAF